LTRSNWKSRRWKAWQQGISELGEKTLQGYCCWLVIAGKEFGKRLLCEISSKEIEAYRDALARNTWSITANRILFIIEQVFLHGSGIDAVSEDPSTNISYLSEKERQRNQVLLPDKLRKLIDASQKLRARFYLPAMIYLGAEHGASK
jgi:hypothetical protein